MENGRARIEAVVPLAVAHGAAVIALTIDEDGMAKTRERKLEVARAIYDIVTGEYGLAPRRPDLRRPHLHPRHRRPRVQRPPPIETIEGIRLIEQELPGVLTDPRRLQRLLRPQPRRPQGPQRRLPLPLHQGRARSRHRPPLARRALRRDPDRRARPGRRPDLLPPPGRPPALHRALRRPRRIRRISGGPDPMAGHGRPRAPPLPDPPPQERRHRSRHRRGRRANPATPSKSSTTSCCRR